MHVLCFWGGGLIALLTNRRIENRSVEPSCVLEKALIAILAGMVFLRALDVFSPVPDRDLGCTPKLANRAVIPCAIRDAQH